MEYAASTADIEAPALAESEPSVQTPLADQTRRRRARELGSNTRMVAHVAASTATLCCCCTAVFCVLAPLVWLPFALKVWVDHSREPCDQPLPAWLESYLLFTLLAPYCKAGFLRTFCGWDPNDNEQPPRRVRVFNHCMDCLPIVWMVLARVLISGSRTCKTTNPTLFKFVDWYSSFMGIFLAVQLVIKCIGMFLLHRWVARNGELPEWLQCILQRANAASPDTINKIETVEYEPSLFADPSDPADERPAGECCICLQAYDAELEIKRTLCGHLVHTECLEEWLRRARTCPTCRKDLEEACQTEENRPAENCDSEFV